MGEKDTANSVTMSQLEYPFLFVLDPVTHYYYMPNFDVADMTQTDLMDFLEDVQAGKIQVSFQYM